MFALCSAPTPTRPGRVYPHDRPDPFEERLQVSYMIEQWLVISINTVHMRCRTVLHDIPALYSYLSLADNIGARWLRMGDDRSCVLRILGDILYIMFKG